MADFIRSLEAGRSAGFKIAKLIFIDTEHYQVHLLKPNYRFSGAAVVNEEFIE